MQNITFALPRYSMEESSMHKQICDMYGINTIFMVNLVTAFFSRQTRIVKNQLVTDDSLILNHQIMHSGMGEFSEFLAMRYIASNTPEEHSLTTLRISVAYLCKLIYLDIVPLLINLLSTSERIYFDVDISKYKIQALMPVTGGVLCTIIKRKTLKEISHANSFNPTYTFPPGNY